MADAVSPRPLLDKLGVRPGMRVELAGLDEPWFEALLADRASSIDHDPPEPGTDLVFLAADSIADLARLRALRAAIVPDGAIWVVSHKGRHATLRDIDVIAAGRDAGLVDNKVVAFSDANTALRLVIPLADRPKAPPADPDPSEAGPADPDPAEERPSLRWPRGVPSAAWVQTLSSSSS